MCKTYSIASVKSISMTRKCHNKNNLQTSLRRREGETQNTLNDHMIPEGSSSETNKFLFSSEMITKLETVLLGFSLPVKAAPHACEIRTSQP